VALNEAWIDLLLDLKEKRAPRTVQISRSLAINGTIFGKR
jgi:hypothetical protein